MRTRPVCLEPLEDFIAEGLKTKFNIRPSPTPKHIRAKMISKIRSEAFRKCIFTPHKFISSCTIVVGFCKSGHV